MRLLLITLLLILIPTVALSQITQTGSQMKGIWVEPTTANNGGVELTDLHETFLTYELEPLDGSQPCGDPIPATSPSGGGTVVTTCVVPTEPRTEVEVPFRVWARDTSGNVSEPLEKVIRIDSLPPDPPTWPNE